MNKQDKLFGKAVQLKETNQNRQEGPISLQTINWNDISLDKPEQKIQFPP